MNLGILCCQVFACCAFMGAAMSHVEDGRVEQGGDRILNVTTTVL